MGGEAGAAGSRDSRRPCSRSARPSKLANSTAPQRIRTVLILRNVQRLASALSLSDAKVTLGELNTQASTDIKLRGNPLVFINARESAELSPLFYDGFDPVVYASSDRGRFIVLKLPSGGELVIEQFVEPARAFRRGLQLLRPLLGRLHLAAAS